jgi:hypothetical protein
LPIATKINKVDGDYKVARTCIQQLL